MQETLRERFENRSLSAPGSIVSTEARRVLESALQHGAEPRQSENSQSLVVNGESSSAIDVYTELGQELVAVSTQLQIGVQDDSRIQEIISRLIAAVVDQDVAEISEPFFDALDSIVLNKKITTDTFINLMIFCIRLIRRYKAESLSSNWKGKAVWITEQIYELIATAYQRYQIDAWIQRQGGWSGVLQLVRTKFQTFTDYAIQGRGFTKKAGAATAGAFVILGAAAFIVWYNW